MYSNKAVPIADIPLVLPLAESKVQAGFPSPADDFHVKRIDLTEVLVNHPQATFLLKVSGDSMRCKRNKLPAHGLSAKR